MSLYKLHPQLQADTIHVKSLDLSDLLLMNDQRFPWLILVPRVDAVSEIFELSTDHQNLLIAETMRVARELKNSTHADKINIAALGNQVPQLHIHIIARFKNDAAWPKPVWGLGSAVSYIASPEWLDVIKSAA